MATITASSKWIEGLAPDQPVEEAARGVLELRLNRVWELLPAAAYEADQDVEHVHQLRVASRRAHAALRAFEDCLPRRRGRKLKRQLHRVRRAAGEARDYDVQCAQLKARADAGDKYAAAALPRFAKKRAKAQRPIARGHRRLDAKQFPDRIAELLARLHAPGKSEQPVRLAEFAASSIQRASEKFFAAEATAAEGYEALHRFRIRAKALRYTLEIFASLYQESIRKEIYPAVEEVQELLGEIVDHHVAIVRFDEWRRDSKDGPFRQAMRELWLHEQQAFTESLARYAAQWTPARSSALKEQLSALKPIDSGAVLPLRRKSR